MSTYDVKKAGLRLAKRKAGETIFVRAFRESNGEFSIREQIATLQVGLDRPGSRAWDVLGSFGDAGFTPLRAWHPRLLIWDNYPPAEVGSAPTFDVVIDTNPFSVLSGEMTYHQFDPARDGRVLIRMVESGALDKFVQTGALVYDLYCPGLTGGFPDQAIRDGLRRWLPRIVPTIGVSGVDFDRDHYAYNAGVHFLYPDQDGPFWSPSNIHFPDGTLTFEGAWDYTDASHWAK